MSYTLRIICIIEEKPTPIPAGDLSGMFTVPRASYQSSSMFRNLHYSQFDTGLYQTPVNT